MLYVSEIINTNDRGSYFLEKYIVKDHNGKSKVVTQILEIDYDKDSKVYIYDLITINSDKFDENITKSNF